MLLRPSFCTVGVVGVVALVGTPPLSMHISQQLFMLYSNSLSVVMRACFVWGFGIVQHMPDRLLLF